MKSTKELQRERDALVARMDEMSETYSGCDWCCGGGDEEMAEAQARLRAIDAEMACPSHDCQRELAHFPPSQHDIADWLSGLLGGDLSDPDGSRVWREGFRVSPEQADRMEAMCRFLRGLDEPYVTADYKFAVQLMEVLCGWPG